MKIRDVIMVFKKKTIFFENPFLGDKNVVKFFSSKLVLCNFFFKEIGK